MWTLLIVLVVIVTTCIFDFKKSVHANRAMSLRIFYIAVICVATLLLGMHCLGIDLHALIYMN